MSKNMPTDRAFLDCFDGGEPLLPAQPSTFAEWRAAIIGTLLCTVLRRCRVGGCWKHGANPTLFSGNFCDRHWSEFYFPNDTDDA